MVWTEQGDAKEMFMFSIKYMMMKTQSAGLHDPWRDLQFFVLWTGNVNKGLSCLGRLKPTADPHLYIGCFVGIEMEGKEQGVACLP